MYFADSGRHSVLFGMRSLDPKHTAVVSLDLQAGVVSRYLKGDDALLMRAQEVLNRARSAGMLVVHVRVAFRPGCPEISARNTLLAGIKASPQHQKLFEGTAGAFHSMVAPHADEIVVSKSRVSAFAGTDLDLILRANDISTLVLLGIATSGVVLSSVLEAADRDYEVVVIADCCADLDKDTHACVVQTLLPPRAAVLEAGDFLKLQMDAKH